MKKPAIFFILFSYLAVFFVPEIHAYSIEHGKTYIEGYNIYEVFNPTHPDIYKCSNLVRNPAHLPVDYNHFHITLSDSQMFGFSNSVNPSSNIQATSSPLSFPCNFSFATFAPSNDLLNELNIVTARHSLLPRNPVLLN